MDTGSVDDATLRVVATCRSLTSLSLHRCVGVTEAGLAALAEGGSGAPRLTSLCVAGARVAALPLGALAARLSRLDATGCAQLGDDALRGFAAAAAAAEAGAARAARPALTELLLGGTACTNAGLHALQVRWRRAWGLCLGDPRDTMLTT